jgi:GntR family transcriptional regulator
VTGLRPAPSARRRAGRATRGLNFESHIPLYIQLTEILKERIETGEWQPRQRFASEGEIGAEFGVSRTVVRPALAILVSDGQLTKSKGRGIFVSPPKVVHHFDGLARSLSHSEHSLSRSRIIDISTDDVNERLARALDLPAHSDRVTHIMSIVEVDQQPVGIRDSYLAPLIEGSVLSHVRSGSYHEAPLVLPGGLAFAKAEAEIEVSSASPFESEELGIKAGAPTLLGTYREFANSSSTGSVPIEFARIVYRADITSFRLRLL